MSFDPTADATPDLDPQDRALAACRRSCRFTECTGRGSKARWAHVCSVSGDPRPVPECGVLACEAVASALLPCGWRCPSHAPSVPDPSASLPPASAPRPARVYGQATTDPLGRVGIDPKTRLPIRGGDRVAVSDA